MKNSPEQKLKILFDASPLVNGPKSGVGYFTEHMVQSLANKYPDRLELVGHYFSFLGKKDQLELPSGKNIRYVRSRLLPGKVLSLLRRIGLQIPLEFLFKQTGDVVIFTNFVSWPSLTKIPKMVAIYDLCFVDVPKYVAPKNQMFLAKFVPKSIKNADAVITISEFSKQRIIHNYNINASKIVVIGIPPKENTSTQKPVTGIKGKFILTVGTLEPRKNIINLVEAYTMLPEFIRNNYCLVLAGATGWLIDKTMQRIKKLQQEGYKIVMTGYVSEQQRNFLYTNAAAFVFPTHYEGFGMPILEVMSYGTPIAASNIPVIKEVGQNAITYFDKDDVADITNKLLDILKSNKKIGYKKVLDQYSWDKNADQLYSILLKLTR